MVFELLPALAEKTFITDLRFCNVRLEDNRLYPWIFLIPRCENALNVTLLSVDDGLQLMREIVLAGRALAWLFPHGQVNVAMIGNKTPQLHVHVICRREGDPDWPGVVWDGHCEPYGETARAEAAGKIRLAIEAEMTKPEYNQNQ
ncbi:MAG: HIT family protein [Synergistaceae bacterium]|nr:HIT family protein [Synergistaceae bacterium]